MSVSSPQLPYRLEDHGDEYRRIYACRNRKIDVTDVDAFRSVSQAPKGGEASDAVSALIVALDMMFKRTKDRARDVDHALCLMNLNLTYVPPCFRWQGVKYNRHIKLITDESSIASGDADLMECVKQLQATGTQLSVTLVGSSSHVPGAWGALRGHVGRELADCSFRCEKQRCSEKYVRGSLDY
eukprot:s2272_g2.t1